MMTKILISLAAAGLIVAAAPAFAGPEVNTTTGAVLVNGKPAPGLAVHGFDVVAYFTESKPVQGDAKFALVHKEATYRFTSQASLDAFKSNPTKYEPADGGYCAYAVSLGSLSASVPEAFTIHDGRLYLTSSTAIRAVWSKDMDGNIRKADANWPGLTGN